jgi:SAM-dependent methyltransferase
MIASLLRNLFRPGPQPGAAGVRRLHLGCGRDIRQGWINLDRHRLPGVDVVADLDDCRKAPLPLPDGSIDEFLGSHVLEHLRDPLPFMQELHRIASPGATAVFRLPYGSTDDADEDPTHVRRYFLNSFHYFSQLAYRSADYGYRGDWDTQGIALKVDAERHAGKSNPQLLEEIRSLRNVVMEMTVTLRAVKPARTPDAGEAPPIRITINRVTETQASDGGRQ